MIPANYIPIQKISGASMAGGLAFHEALTGTEGVRVTGSDSVSGSVLSAPPPRPLLPSYDGSGVDGDTLALGCATSGACSPRWKAGSNPDSKQPSSGSPFDSGLPSLISTPPTMRQAWRDYRKAMPWYAELLTIPVAALLLPVAVETRVANRVKGWMV